MVQLVRVTDGLPEGFAALRAKAETEGHRNMARLEAEIAQAPEMFTALLAAFGGGELLGIGGLTTDPANPSAQRMRRLYVIPHARRQGIARALANGLLSEALNITRLITVHAGDAHAARFWEAMGFAPVEDRVWSHEFLNG